VFAGRSVHPSWAGTWSTFWMVMPWAVFTLGESCVSWVYAGKQTTAYLFASPWSLLRLQWWNSIVKSLSLGSAVLRAYVSSAKE
jgi:hypothetical protein